MEDIREILTNNLQKKKARIIAISGAWGSGKTYFWLNFAQNCKINKNLSIFHFLQKRVIGIFWKI